MRKTILSIIMLAATYITAAAQTAPQVQTITSPQVQTVNGILEGIDCSGVKVFKGVPFAAPPSWQPQMEGSTARGEMGGSETGKRLRSKSHAGKPLRRHDVRH